MNYRIGLDLGITSVGWAVLENDKQGNPIRIVDLGSRIFEKAENPQDGSSLALPRRNARGARRRIRRRNQRIKMTKYLLENAQLMSVKEIEQMYQAHDPKEDIYTLKVKGLDEKLTKKEIARILISTVKRRGYKSNSKAEESTDKELGKLLNATSENERIMAEKKYRTISEMYLKDDRFQVEMADGTKIRKIRNTTNEYRATVLRSMVIEEIEKILHKQQEYYPQITEEVINQYLQILQSQRNFDEGPGEPSPYAGDQIEKMLGNCRFEKEEKRAPKASYTFEYFKILQDLNHIKIENSEKENRPLTKEEREKIIKLAKQKANLTYASIRKELTLKNDERFNIIEYNLWDLKNALEEIYDEAEKERKFKEFESYHKIRLALDKVEKGKIKSLTQEELDCIAYALTIYKNDEKRKQYITDHKIKITDEMLERLLTLSFSKVGNLSIKAMKKMIPHLEEGLTYDKAVNKVYQDVRGVIQTEKSTKLSIRQLEEEITNPVVKRAISQTIKVLNAIVLKYGKPDVVVIELSRQMKANFHDRNKIRKAQEGNRIVNERIKERIEKEFGKTHVTGQDMLKLKLWEEQQGICMYSGKNINIQDLFTEMVDVDHIIPYSICFDDSYQNKVLVLASENRQKSNKIPYQYIKEARRDVEEYEIRVKSVIKRNAKLKKLLKKEITPEEIEDWKARNLQDTQYITKVVYNLIRNHLSFSDNENFKRKVIAVNGNIAAHVRKRLGINKLREDGDQHHAIDAAVIATITQKMIQKITTYYQQQEARISHLNRTYQDAITAEEIDKEIDDKEHKTLFPPPWEKFAKELDIRQMQTKERIIECLQEEGINTYPNYDDIRPIFVSRMPKRKIKGQAHKDTIRRMKKEETGEIKAVVKTELQNLKLDKDGEIKGYPETQKRDDRLLYEALRHQLVRYQNDAKKAFADPFFKPKADGTPGNIVKKVKLEEKITIGVELENKKAIAGNGGMVRIDIFKTKEGYYYVPIYVSDTIKEKLPSKASVPNKSYSQWKEMKEEDFVFSLYPGDLIKIVKPHMKLQKESDGTSKEVDEAMVYYIKAGIANGSIAIATHDNQYKQLGVYFKTIQNLEKYEVDVLGNYHKVKIPEKRQSFHQRKTKEI